ncbi:hypothetical protein [Aureimonas sp. Leaf454]|uniref:hypothetical protein n=1 Tax=Aureimonas sp. Leaf454 TaxID=1736381 RepID=UPI001FCCE3C5|nr:hypothetical protein [Aureimonas sp. Leaf454]
MSLTEFLELLPGLKPRLARKEVLAGEALDPVARTDIHHREDFLDTTLDVGPDAAAAMLAAYREGRLPMQRGASPGATSLADGYASNRDTARQRDERRRRAAALLDASVVVEGDLSDHAFLDRLFHAHLGKGAGSLNLAGITVTKSLSRHSSNSGRSSGWGVGFRWIGSDGKPRTSSTVPPEAFNRRNDPERDWGLPD